MYIKRFENFSQDYYTNFSEKDFPMEVNFSDPHSVCYKRTKLVPGSNNISLRFDLDGEQPEKDNPYSGSIPSIITIDIGITYNNDNTKTYVTITGGMRTWWSFSYEDKMIQDIETSEWKLTDKSKKGLINLIDKYSK